MSFNLPQNVPDFSSTARQVEDFVWTHANGRGRSTPRHRGGDSDLPLYKDKPRQFVPRNSSISGVRPFPVLALVGIILFIFFFLSRSEDDDSITPGSKSKSTWWFSEPSSELSSREKQDAIREAFLESWEDYASHALGKDVYHPLSKRSENMAPNGLGWIVVDSIDTMMIMKLQEPLEVARNWIANNLTYDQDYEVNTFETTIRMLGGLLSAHYLSGFDDLYLEKAVDLANRLLGAFDSTSGVPYASVNLHTYMGVKSHADGGASSTAEATSLQLEFKYVSKLTGEALYWTKAEKVMQVVDNNQVEEGLVPIFIHPDTGKFTGRLIRLGSRGDSYYEYLLKQYLQTNNRETVYRQLYDEAMTGVKKRLIHKSYPNGYTFVSELEQGIGGPVSNKMDHLVCFLPGNLALGATDGMSLNDAKRTSWTVTRAADMRLAKELMKSCYEMYKATKTGIAPEIVVFNTDPSIHEDLKIKPADTHNLQRPETVESLFIMWRITKDPVYREWGWNIFQAWRKYAKLPDRNGYSSLESVNDIPPRFRDNLESFWLAETLKYLYLLFEDDESVLPLQEVVFNTEGHPFPKFNMEPLFKTGWERGAPRTAPHPDELPE
ncbi:glycoside hydrolase [Lipomyces oligophaga]|uniref:glycoside hydrolase n=1 Tax=Lipomyces oligophaga TaxID=45792 RepID=UPI0034CD5238